MFGHQDHVDGQSDNSNHPEPQADATLGGQDTPVVTSGAPPVTHPSDDTMRTDDTAGDFIMDEPAAPSHPGKSIADDHHADETDAAAPAATAEVPEDLLELKQGALQQLTPLLDHLDQTADEKFRTTMMMIQASDNPTLLKTAYEAAQNIEDEKARAQALLDVVNEINYFTQQHGEAAAE